MRSLTFLGLMLFTSLTFAQTSIDVGRGAIPLTVPAGYSSEAPAPLIVLLHGYGSSGAGQDGYMKFSAIADRYGFLLATPDGTIENGGRNSRFWNASHACCNFYESEDDDSAYVLAIINEVKKQYTVDERRVYLVGHSNGGFMSYKAAHDHSDVIAAIVSLAGAEATIDAGAPANPVHILQIHGTADGTIAYEGGDIRGNVYPSAVETVERWAGYNGCSIEGVTTGTVDLDASIEGAESTMVRYSKGCKVGGSAELWTIPEGAHIPPISDVFAEKVVEWLYGHPKVKAIN